MTSQASLNLFRKILSGHILNTQNLNVPNITTMPRQNTGSDFAKYLLLHTSGGKNTVRGSGLINQGAATEQPSLLNKIIDTMSAPLYTGYALGKDYVKNTEAFAKNPSIGAALNYPKEAVKDVSAGFVRGVDSLSTIPGFGQYAQPKKLSNWANREVPQQFGNQILDKAGVKNPWIKYPAGFAMDVVADPLTYVPGLDVMSILRKGGRAARLLEARNAADAKDVLAAKAANSNTEPFIKTGWTPNEGKPFIGPLQQSASGRELARPRKLVPESFKLPAETSRNAIPHFDPANPINVPRAEIPRPPVADLVHTNPNSFKAGEQSFRDVLARQSRNESQFVDQSAKSHVKMGRDTSSFIPSGSLRMGAQDRFNFLRDMAQGKMAKIGKVFDPKKNLISTIAATHVVDEIATGVVPKIGPKIAVATGAERATAEHVTDSFIDTLLGPRREKGRFIKRPSKPKALTPDLQVSLLRKIMQEAPKSILPSLRSAEDHLIRLGVQPLNVNGMRMRLSDVLVQAGVDGASTENVLSAYVSKDLRKMDPIARKAIETVQARRAISQATMISSLAENAAKQKANILSTYNFPVAGAKLKEVAKVASEAARNFGMTEKEALSVYDLVGHQVSLDNIPIDDLMNRLGPELIRAVSDKRMTPEILNKINIAITKSVGNNPEKIAKTITGNGFVDGFLLRFSTSIGRGPMKDRAIGLMELADFNASSRLEWAQRQAKDFTTQEKKMALHVTQGIPGAREIASPRELTLAAKFTDYFESMLSSSGFKTIKDNPGTAAVNAMMKMADVNKYLKAGGSKFQFISSPNAMRRFDGVSRDYSEAGHGWMKSWENADAAFQDPVSLIYDIDLAMEKTAKQYTFFDEFGRLFGATTKGGLNGVGDVGTHQLPHPRLDHLYFPKRERDEMIRLTHDIEQGMWMPNSPAVKFVARAIRAWKSSVTIYLPSFHERNAIGDTSLMWQAGHNDPTDFIRSIRVMSSQQGRGKYRAALDDPTLARLNKFTDPNSLEWAKTSGSDVVLKANGVSVTADEVFVAANTHGILPNYNRSEDLFGDTPLGVPKESDALLMKKLKQPFGGHVHSFVAQAAEYREHWIRLAHFQSAIRKGLNESKTPEKDLARIFEKAAIEVRHWHPDGRDLTIFEQKIRTFAVPFYSWTRKVIPLLLETAVTRPSKLLYYPRAQMALQGIGGVNTSGGVLDPFPNDQQYPDWLREKGIGPIQESGPGQWWGNLGRGGVGLYGQETGSTIINPGNPFQDTVSQFGGMGKPQSFLQGIGSSLSPGLKMPAELVLDTNSLGTPISQEQGGQGYKQYFASNIPGMSPVQNVLEVGKPAKSGRQGGFDFQALLNYLTAAGVTGSGYYQNSAEFEAKNRAKLAAKRQ